MLFWTGILKFLAKTLAMGIHFHQGLISRNASNVSFGHAEHCFLTVWTPKSLCQNLLKMTFRR